MQEEEKSPKRLSPEKAAQPVVCTPEREIVSASSDKKTDDRTGSVNDSESKTEEPYFPPGGNIFLQIDPTVRKKSPEEPKKDNSSYSGSQPGIVIQQW